ncbi:MAG: hypothetical protein PHZ00_06700 [Candidatus Peribacteraceae bacterium]|nr:hypothetical protein [Candidatus Peribacteraceae bacterium]
MPRPSLPPLGILILGAFGLIRQKWPSFCVGVLFFGMLLAVGSAYLDRSVDRVLETLGQQTGLTAEEVQATVEAQFREIADSASVQSDSGAIIASSDGLNSLLLQASSLQDQLRAGVQPAVTKDLILPSYLARMGTTAFGIFVFYIVVLFLSMLFFCLLSVSGPASISDVVLRLPFTVLPAVGLVLLIVLRSFLWVPFLGLPLGLYFLPRLSLAPILLLSGEAGIFRSAAVSMHRTKGLWFPLFLRFLGGFLLLLSIGWFVILIAGSVMLFSVKIGFLLWFCGLIVLVAVAMAFLTVVAATVG